MRSDLPIWTLRPGDVLIADGTWPEGSPLNAGIRGTVVLDGNYLVWFCRPLGMNIDLALDGQCVRGLMRPPLENEKP